MPAPIEVGGMGGGQAGLAIRSDLTHPGRPHGVLEQAPPIAPAGRPGRWTPVRACPPTGRSGCRGVPSQGDDPDGFMPRADVVHHLQPYAASFQAPGAVECRSPRSIRHGTATGMPCPPRPAPRLRRPPSLSRHGLVSVPPACPLHWRLAPEIIQRLASHYRNPSTPARPGSGWMSARMPRRLRPLGPRAPAETQAWSRGSCSTLGA